MYGTLKTGFPNHSEMPAGARFLGQGLTVEAYPLVVGAGRCQIPFMLNLPGHGHRLRGEVWEVDDAGLAHLDTFEGCHLRFYVRTNLDVALLTEEEAFNNAAAAAAAASNAASSKPGPATPATVAKQQQASPSIVSAGAYLRGHGGTRALTPELSQLEHIEEYSFEHASRYQSRHVASREGLMDTTTTERH